MPPRKRTTPRTPQPRKRPTRRKPFEAELGGVKFKLPTTPEKVDAFALRFATQGDGVSALQRLASPEDYRAITNSTVVVTQVDILNELERYYSHLTELSSGNS